MNDTTAFSRAVGRNTMVQFAGKILGTVVGLVTAAMILRYLHPAGNGAYTTAMAYLGIFSVIADLGLYLILIRDISKPGADPDHVVGNLLALRWVSAFLVLGAGAGLVWIFHFTAPEKIAVLIGTGSFVAIAASQLLIGVFQSRLAMIYVTSAEFVGRLFLLGATWWVIHQHGTLTGIMVAVVIGSLANFLLLWLMVRRFVRLSLRFDWPYWRQTLRDTLPIAVSIVLNLIYFRADTIILRLYHSQYDVGLYGAAYKILEILNTFPIMFVGLILPALGSAFAGNDQERFRRVFQRGFDLLLMAAVPILIGGSILARPALVLLGQADYAATAPVLRLLLFAVAALYLSSLSGHTVTIIHRQRQMVWTYLTVAAVGMVIYFSLIPKFSLYGAATGTIVTECLMAIVGYILILRVMRFRLRLAIMPKLLLSGLVMAGVLWWLQASNVILAAAVGGLVYLAALLATRAIDPRTIMEIFSSRASTPSSLPLE
ncbi:MAG: flippase [Candidatus Kerfeldbacteria bacterium]|nr:flippase [Candidatus Kerfeldbacteria bacterium]